MSCLRTRKLLVRNFKISTSTMGGFTDLQVDKVCSPDMRKDE